MPKSSRRSKKPLKRRSRSRSGGAGTSVEPPNRHLMHFEEGVKHDIADIHNPNRFKILGNEQNGALDERTNALSKRWELISPAAQAYNAIILKYWNEWSEFHFTPDALGKLKNEDGKNRVATCFFNKYDGAIHSGRDLEKVFFECLDNPPPEGWHKGSFGGKKGRKTRRVRK